MQLMLLAPPVVSWLRERSAADLTADDVEILKHTTFVEVGTGTIVTPFTLARRLGQDAMMDLLRSGEDGRHCGRSV